MNLSVLLLTKVSSSKNGCTGYELNKEFNEELHYFWNTSHQHVYRLLDTLMLKGHLNYSIHKQDGKPDKKIYNITSKGRRYLDEMTDATPPSPATRLPLSAQIFSRHAQAKCCAELLNHHAQSCTKKIEALGRLRHRIAHDNLRTALLERQINLLKADLLWAKDFIDSTYNIN